MKFQSHLMLLVSYALIFAPGCKNSKSSTLQGSNGVKREKNKINILELKTEVDRLGVKQQRKEAERILTNIDEKSEFYIMVNGRLKPSTKKDMQDIVSLKYVELDQKKKSQIFVIKEKGDHLAVSIQSLQKKARFDLVAKTHDLSLISKGRIDMSQVREIDLARSLVNYEITSLNFDVENKSALQTEILKEHHQLKTFTSGYFKNRPTILQLFIATATIVAVGAVIFAAAFLNILTSMVSFSEANAFIGSLLAKGYRVFTYLAVACFCWMIGEILVTGFEKLAEKSSRTLPSNLIEGL